jgi:hypothetical protein
MDMNLDAILEEMNKEAADQSAPKDPQSQGSAQSDIMSVAQEVIAMGQNFLSALQSNQVAPAATDENQQVAQQQQQDPNQQQMQQQPMQEAMVTLQIPASAILKTASTEAITTEEQAIAFFGALNMIGSK